MIYFQILLDTMIMVVLCYALAGQPLHPSKKVLIWFLCFHGLCLLFRYQNSTTHSLIPGFEINNYDLLPVNNPILLFMLFLGVLILNSSLIRPISEMKAVVVTFLSFLIWILFRTFSIAATGLVLDQGAALFPYAHRVVTLCLALALYYVLIMKRGNSFLGNYSGVFTKIMLVQSTLVVLAIVIYANFETAFVTQNLLFILIVFSLVISMNLWIIYEQNKRSRQEKRVSAIEQYLPVIDELVSEVRARQHEFHNKLLAIHSIVETAPTLPEARSQIATYTKDVMMQTEVREILQLDSKVIGGFLYTKMKIAELKKITITPHIHALFGPMKTEEHQLVEVLGVLIDNALEASYPGDEIMISVTQDQKQPFTEIIVMNPHPPKSSLELMQMFTKGFTTKSQAHGARGYGLYNVKQIVLQQKGKIITRNTEIEGVPYLSIGVQLP
ncbi:GHKL domain-containing protein [Paenibacillus sp. Marseille-Q4541]|uniref:sensor histidine kinase n=1 Tax=Paenibacillus sp. Marseille-Q4541 TaxID=2831522 RepID=UPI001BA61BC3|nr:GHKL domain-containing protein [Paenibacillus sp. Marseille-Q4541]